MRWLVCERQLRAFVLEHHLVASIPLKAGCKKKLKRSPALRKGPQQVEDLSRECRMAAMKKEGGGPR